MTNKKQRVMTVIDRKKGEISTMDLIDHGDHPELIMETRRLPGHLRKAEDTE